MSVTWQLYYSVSELKTNLDFGKDQTRILSSSASENSSEMTQMNHAN